MSNTNASLNSLSANSFPPYWFSHSASLSDNGSSYTHFLFTPLSFVSQLLSHLCFHSLFTLLKLSGKGINHKGTYVSFFRSVLVSPSCEAVQVQVSSGYGWLLLWELRVVQKIKTVCPLWMKCNSASEFSSKPFLQVSTECMSIMSLDLKFVM